MADRQASYPGVDPARAGAAGHCPRCGKGLLFRGLLRLRARCTRCDLDFTPLEQADGPAFFVMTIVGFVVVGLALYVEVVYSPSILVHLLLWIPLTLILSLPLMRVAKGVMAGLQYRNRAAEGRLVGDDDAP